MMTQSQQLQPPKLLIGQKALVTGASSGIGTGIARSLASAGAAVAINYRSKPEDAQRIVDDIRAAGETAIAVQADVSQESQVQTMFKQTIKAFGTINLLVSNAGVQKDAAFVDMTLKDWKAVIDVNLTGQFLCAREAVREFLRRGISDNCKAAGKIIFISSVHELIPWSGHANYAASKGGLMLLMKTMAQELAPQKIRVNSIAPGAIKTDINRNEWETPEAEAKLRKLIPYDRLGEVDEIGKAAVWLASDETDYVNGTTLNVDGGMTLYPGFATGG